MFWFPQSNFAGGSYTTDTHHEKHVSHTAGDPTDLKRCRQDGVDKLQTDTVDNLLVNLCHCEHVQHTSVLTQRSIDSTSLPDTLPTVGGGLCLLTCHLVIQDVFSKSKSNYPKKPILCPGKEYSEKVTVSVSQLWESQSQVETIVCSILTDSVMTRIPTCGYACNTQSPVMPVPMPSAHVPIVPTHAISPDAGPPVYSLPLVCTSCPRTVHCHHHCLLLWLAWVSVPREQHNDSEAAVRGEKQADESIRSPATGHASFGQFSRHCVHWLILCLSANVPAGH